MGKLVISSKFIVHSLIAFFLLLLLPTTNHQLLTVHAIFDPLSAPNNKFGIHIISPSIDEASPAAELVNTNGDWGYVTFLIESRNRNHDAWQKFFDYLRQKHLIPIVRLATEPQGNYWKRPYAGEEEAWADFLNALNWPTKNRYVIIYNEPNHATEWGNLVDAPSYARELDKTITALKARSEDFFVLNAGIDASAPSKPALYEDEVIFLRQMNEAVPGIFNKLDGWVSHSYPNPAFAGSPYGVGRGTVRTYIWEQQLLKSLGVNKDLPIFITETGWRHAEGINYDPFSPTSDKIANYYQIAFADAWSSNQIVAVTPFLLNYQEPPFDHFSFKRLSSEKDPHQHLAAENQAFGVETPTYYPQYEVLKTFAKVAGKPQQINSAQLTKGEVFSSIVSGETYTISLNFKNTGQAIWGDGEKITFAPVEGGKELGIEPVEIPQGTKVEPNGDYTFQIHLKAPEKGNFKVALQLFSEGKQFDSKPIEFKTEVKEPVILKILTKLQWKDSAAGDYILRVSGAVGESTQAVRIDENGTSKPIEARYLLPDYEFDFTLEKENYKLKTVEQKVNTGENILDFGELQPNLLKNLLNPKTLWDLLPFSN